MIRVLVVDDSAVLRQSTKFILESDPEMRVVGEACNGNDAITQVVRLRPDVITMDIQMPKMDGLEAIREIMAEHPAPIVVVTGVDLVREADLAARATKLGAVSILQRPASISNSEYKGFADKLIRQVKAMSSVKVIHRARSLSTTTMPKMTNASADAVLRTALPSRTVTGVKTEIVVIGSSTGGPAALHKILSGLPKNFPLPILIVQHISFGFVDGLASWLNDACALSVQVAKLGERVEPGKVYIAPDDQHMTLDRFYRISLNAAPPMGGHRPSVTVLFQSAAAAFGASTLAVILTGMGADGAIGMKALHDAGAITIAQDQSSCVVFGMPKEAIALGAIQNVVPLDKIAGKIQELIAG